MAGLLEWAIFIALSTTAVVMAAGMLLTMSMYRAGLALMSSFVALAGLFILLDADLLAVIQVMMNVGGMLVMILFMVMMMMDPGGQDMTQMKQDMKLPGPGALSMSMPHGDPPPEHGDEHQGGHGQGMTPREHYQMMMSMAMSTRQLPWAIALGIASAIVLVVLVIRTPWTESASSPSGDAAAAVGDLLLSRYMIAFEGAAFLILSGIVAAVIFGKREQDGEDESHEAPEHQEAGQHLHGGET